MLSTIFLSFAALKIFYAAMDFFSNEFASMHCANYKSYIKATVELRAISQEI